MDCQDLTQLIQELSPVKKKVEDHLVINDVQAAGQTKNEATARIKVFENEYRYDKQFFALLSQSKFISEIGRLSTAKAKIPTIYEQINKLFPQVEKKAPLLSSVYQSFVKELITNQQIRKQFGNAAGNYQDSPDAVSWLYGIVSALFLNRYLGETNKLKVKNLPKELKNSFGMFLNRGSIEVDAINGGHSFLAMGGGDVRVGLVEGTGDLAYRMRDGKLSVKEIRGEAENHIKIGEYINGGQLDIGKVSWAEIGSRAGGGTVRINHATYSRIAHFAYEGTFYVNDFIGLDEEIKETEFAPCLIGTRADRATIMVQNIYKRIPDQKNMGRTILIKTNPEVLSSLRKNQGHVFVYDEKNDSILRPNYNKEYQTEKKPPTYNTPSSLCEYLSSYHGLCFYSSGDEGLDYIDYQMISTGIVVLKDCPLGNEQIGWDMTGGIIIIDNDKISLDEIQSKVCKKRKGGMIFYLQKKVEHQGIFGVKRTAEFVEVR